LNLSKKGDRNVPPPEAQGPATAVFIKIIKVKIMGGAERGKFEGRQMIIPVPVLDQV
jgi:hypothetical protein